MSVVGKVSELRHEERIFTDVTVIVEPGGSKSVALGAYSSGAKQPKFTISIEPDIGDQLEASLSRNDIPGSQRYVLFYSLHNNGVESCTVTLLREG